MRGSVSSSGPLSERFADSTPGSAIRGRSTVYARDGGYVVASRDRYLIQVFRSGVSLSATLATTRALDELTRQYDSLVLVCVMEPSASLVLSPDVRRCIHAYVSRYSDRLAAGAVVFEGDGFKSTVLRSIVTGITLASRSTHPIKVFVEPEAAVTWASGLLRHARVTPAEVAAEVAELRAQLDTE